MTKIAYRNGGWIGVPKGDAKDCVTVEAAPVLPVGYVVSASRIADRRMIPGGIQVGGFDEMDYDQLEKHQNKSSYPLSKAASIEVYFFSCAFIGDRCKSGLSQQSFQA